MQYEWDENKNRANKAKHGVDFNSAPDFDWDSAIETIDDRDDYGEERWIALGFIRNKVHVMLYTFRPNAIRIISLRKATKLERKYYEQ